MAHVFSGQKVRDARTRAGIRPEMIAVAISRSVDSLRLYEQGRTDPPASVIAALANALHLEPGEFFDQVAP